MFSKYFKLLKQSIRALLAFLMRWVLAYEPLAARLNRGLMIFPGLHARLRGLAVAQGLKMEPRPLINPVMDHLPDDAALELLGPCARNIYRQLKAARKAFSCAL